MTQNVDIAIIGSGMMGSTLALLLHKTFPNKKICILDRYAVEMESESSSPLTSFDARSTALAPTTVELMQSLGVWGAMLPYATAIDSVQVSDKGHIGWTKLTKSDNSQQALGYVVDNRAMGRALTQAVLAKKNIEVCASVEVRGLTAITQAMRISILDAESLNAKLVIVADGANSSLGKRMGIQHFVKNYEQTAIVANIEFDLPHSGVAYERFTANGPLALLPLGGEKGCKGALVWTWPSTDVEQVMAKSDSEFLQAIQDCFGYRLGNFINVSSRVGYPLTLSIANEQVRSNFVLMGNAAHFLHPVAGQGFNLGARDALRLAKTLQCSSCELGDLSTLMEYQKAQAQDQASTILLSHGFNEVFGSSNLALMGLRNVGMLAIENCDYLRQVFIRQLSGRGSPKVYL